MTGDLIERLKELAADLRYHGDFRSGIAHALSDIEPEIASLRTALATEREARERAEKAFLRVCEELGIAATAASYLDARAIRASLAEAKRLLKAMLSNPDKISKDEARRFLAQESNDGR